MRFVFLYTELAEYFLSCCRELDKQAEVHIFRYPVNKEAPFQFEFSELNIYNKSDFNLFSLKEKIKSIQPDVIVCSGWMDKDYNLLARDFRNIIPVVAAFDTSWRGDLKQQFLRFISSWYLHSRFTHAWVPGKKQAEYALKLGFKKDKILTGFYSCNVTYFNGIFNDSIQQKKSDFPKRFLFVGRYYDFKGVQEMWRAFVELKSEFPNDWQLWCAGVGDIIPKLHPDIRHLGFIQPGDMREILRQTGVFILPSRFEPWGVVVHEHAAAGFPLLLSDQVGASEQFLVSGTNGFTFQANNIGQIKNAMKQIILLNSTDLLRMAEISHSKAQAITPGKWVQQILS